MISIFLTAYLEGFPGLHPSLVVENLKLSSFPWFCLFLPIQKLKVYPYKVEIFLEQSKTSKIGTFSRIKNP
jgi:hypothetical protein